MNLAVVAVFARFGEGKGEMIVGVQGRRVEELLNASHGVRLVVMIGPRNFCAGWDFQARRVKCEVADFYLGIV